MLARPGSHLIKYRRKAFAQIGHRILDLRRNFLIYTDTNAATFSAQLKEAGVPDGLAGMIAGFVADIKYHQFEIRSNDLEQMLGRKPASLKRCIERAL